MKKIIIGEVLLRIGHNLINSIEFDSVVDDQ